MTTETKDVLTFEGVRENIPHYKALGTTRVSLGRLALNDYPWEAARHFEIGGSHRLDMDTTCRFSVDIDGVSVTWWIDLEPYDANGKGAYYVSCQAFAAVLPRLVETVRAKFIDYLLNAADKVQAKADEYMNEARRQYGDAAALRALARGPEA